MWQNKSKVYDELLTFECQVFDLRSMEKLIIIPVEIQKSWKSEQQYLSQQYKNIAVLTVNM